MLTYIFHRLFLIIPTLFDMLINFIIVQAAPGGPVEQVLAKIRGQASDTDMRLGAASEAQLHPMGSAEAATGGARN